MAIIAFLIILSVLVLIHEAGHFLAARLFGVKAEECGYGFPPRLIGFVKDKGRWKRVGRKDREGYANTIWSINWLPLGGFVRIKGEQGEGESDNDSLNAKPIWQRLVIMAAGVGMNWLLAAVLLSLVFSLGARISVQDAPSGAEVRDRRVEIAQVLPGTPAEKAGLKAGDSIISVSNLTSVNAESAREAIVASGEKPLLLRYRRDGEIREVTVTPVYLKEAERMGIGVAIADTAILKYPPLQAIEAGTRLTYLYTRAILWAFGDLAKDLFVRQEIRSDIAGPVGIAVMTGQIAQEGLVPLLQFSAVLSINLAIINILPIPALDGGRMLFLALEKLRRRPISRKLEAAIHNIAFVLLIALILLVTVRDITRLF